MDGELIEVYLTDDEYTSRFSMLPTCVKSQVLALGLLSYEVSKKKLMEMKDRDWNEELVSRITLKEQEIEKLQIQIGNTKGSHEVFIQELTHRTKLILESAVVAEQNRNALLISNLEKRNSCLLERISALEVSQDNKLERAVTSSTKVLNDEIKRLTNRLDMEVARSRNSQTLNEKSTDKGKCGEVFVLGELNKLFPCGEIEDTHTEPHRGDFIVRNEGLTMMVESKNYKRNVQKGEIDKFYKDIDDQRNSEYDCAILVSLTSGISNRDDFSFEIRNDIPIIFIHNAAANFVAIRMAFKLFQIIVSSDQVDFANKEVLDTFRNTAKALRRSMIKQKAALDKSYATQLDSINKQTELLEVLFAAAKVSF